MCFLQLVMGRAYLNEQPKGSDVLSESSVAFLAHEYLDLYKSVTDQCAHGAQIDGQYIKKATELWSNKDIKGLSPAMQKLCAKDHEHLHLRGSNKKGALTAQAAGFQDGLCQSCLTFA